MNTFDRLSRTLASAYNNAFAGHSAFKAHAEQDEAFLTAAQTEHDRLVGLEGKLGCPLSQRCYASAKHLSFLRAALAQHQQEQEMPSKLKALAERARTTVTDIENRQRKPPTGSTAPRNEPKTVSAKSIR